VFQQTLEVRVRELHAVRDSCVATRRCSPRPAAEAQIIAASSPSGGDLELVRNLVHGNAPPRRYRCENCGFKARQFTACPPARLETYPAGHRGIRSNP